MSSATSHSSGHQVDSGLLRIATRKSPLALWQAEHIKSQLELRHPGLQVELVTFTTRGDVLLDTPLAKVGGKGLFVKELEHALLQGDADIAVHSMKDVPVEFPPGLGLAVICEREDPHDAFVSNCFDNVAALPQGARVGSCSLRRQCQLREVRPDLAVINLRGNVNSRLAKLDSGEFDAIILAASGLKRLGMADRIRARLSAEESLPAVGQGALGIECRLTDELTLQRIGFLSHPESTTRLRAERAMNARLQGGCQVPIAGFAECLAEDQLRLRGLVGDPDGRQVLRAEVMGAQTDAEQLGTQLADQLLAQGAREILDRLYAED